MKKLNELRGACIAWRITCKQMADLPDGPKQAEAQNRLMELDAEIDGLVNELMPQEDFAIQAIEDGQTCVRIQFEGDHFLCIDVRPDEEGGE